MIAQWVTEKPVIRPMRTPYSILVVALAACSGERADPQGASAPARPALVEHDFGTIPHGQVRAHDFVLRVPAVHPLVAPIVNTIPLQILAYETARRRGCDIDQPRNLAKTVTVQ